MWASLVRAALALRFEAVLALGPLLESASSLEITRVSPIIWLLLRNLL
jgi:hypothetical protein